MADASIWTRFFPLRAKWLDLDTFTGICVASKRRRSWFSTKRIFVLKGADNNERSFTVPAATFTIAPGQGGTIMILRTERIVNYMVFAKNYSSGERVMRRKFPRSAPGSVALSPLAWLAPIMYFLAALSTTFFLVRGTLGYPIPAPSTFQFLLPFAFFSGMCLVMAWALRKEVSEYRALMKRIREKASEAEAEFRRHSPA
jgi:hypothetical protein